MSVSKSEYSELIETRKVRLVLNNNTLSSIGNFGVAGLVTLILSIQFEDPQWTWIHFWLTYMMLISIMRLLVGIQLNRQIDEYQVGKNLCRKIFFLLIIFTAVGWAILSILFLNPDNSLTNAYIAVAISGIGAGSMSSLTPVKKYFFSFILIILIPPTLIFFSYGQNEGYIFSLMIVLFIIFMIRSGKMFTDSIEDNLKLNLNNENLIDELKNQTEKALVASELKSQFLANMSHEIRTPMNGIAGFIHLLEEKETDREKLDYLKTIDHSTKDLLRIINDILDFSKIESDQLLIDEHEFNPKTELESCLKLFDEKASQKAIQFIVDIPNPLPQLIKSDSVRLKQVVNNLLSNAIKFSPEHSKIELSVSFNKDIEQMTISVRDYGIGICDEKLKIIFDPFVQEDVSVTRKYGGTGLGLAISSRLIEMLGGKLEVESEKEVGTRFFFTIKTPVIKFEGIESKQTKSNSIDLKGHILVVQDNKVNQMLVCKILDKKGISYDLANDGLEALECFKNNQYDLILMDISMPNMSGVEATEKIRQIEHLENKNRTPISALTANAMEGDREKFLASGMDEYLTKPIEMDKFNEILANYLS